ncbi:MAG TPA: Na+/H+ antiporter subunit E [Burkholderiales bacterium]|nr:Na+/H+ antiporter subunit E [Burkholderiales bacterium]
MNAPGRARLLHALVQRIAVFAALWWALAEGRAEAWLVGAPVIAAAVGASLVLQGKAPWRLRPLAALRSLAWFARRSLVAGVDVALRALRPHPGLAPGFVTVRPRLADPAARVLLADALSLVPGTLSVELREDGLELHVLDRAAPTEREVRELEAHIAAALGLRLEEA